VANGPNIFQMLLVVYMRLTGFEYCGNKYMHVCMYVCILGDYCAVACRCVHAASCDEAINLSIN